MESKPEKQKKKKKGSKKVTRVKILDKAVMRTIELARTVPSHKLVEEWKPSKVCFREVFEVSGSKSKPPFRCNKTAEIPDYRTLLKKQLEPIAQTPKNKSSSRLVFKKTVLGDEIKFNSVPR